MPRYSKLGKKEKRVSFEEDPTRYDFQAPRPSGEMRPSIDSATRDPPNYEKTDESDDEVDKLLASDPLNDDEEKRSGGRHRLPRRKRRILIFGMLSVVILALFIGVCATSATIAHERAKIQSMTAAEKTAQDTAKALEEVKGMTEVPTLIGTIPIEAAEIPQAPDVESEATELAPGPDMPHLVNLDESIISVPETTIDYNNEAADKAAYEAEAAKDDGHGPPELSAEAVEQVQGVNSQLSQAESASTVDNIKNYMADFWDWIDAKWDDLMSNDAESGDVIY